MTDVIDVENIEINFEPLESKRYIIESKIGDGGFCEVLKAKDLISNIYVAIKRSNRNKSFYKKFPAEEVNSKIQKIMYREASVMRALDHPNLLKLYDLVDDGKCIFLVMPLVEGGELFDRIMKQKKFSERDSAIVLTQMINGVHYMHEHGYVHRDIKPENVLFKNPVIISNLVITDFGLSREFSGHMYNSCGTIDYSAPELLRNKITKSGYDEKIDNWSIGIVAYIMLCGYPPFYSLTQDPEEISRKIMAGTYLFHAPHWDYITKTAKDFVSSFLTVEPAERMTLSASLSNPFLYNIEITLNDI